MKVFHCHKCEELLFFENINCVRCGRALAYSPEAGRILSFEPAGGNLWASVADGKLFRFCDNYVKYNVCNWAIAAEDPHSLCRSCDLTETIPNLSTLGNNRLWYKLEVAKRRLVYTLDQLGLPLTPRTEDGQGLAFQFLDQGLTGHAQGLITVNIAEADDAERVRRRNDLGEPYRTLLGHFRHESGHYYWDRLIQGTPYLDEFRTLFGDERQDYAKALERHYSQGSHANWQDAYVSAYATMHPWEDWAETWAHYLHMTDTLETAAACGLSIKPRRSDEPSAAVVPDPVSNVLVPFSTMIESWNSITYVLNNLNRGLGNDDAYPFVLSAPAIEKLRFVHARVSVW